jgi:hypothetical protein
VLTGQKLFIFRPKLRKTSFGADFYEKAVVGPLRRHYDDVYDRLR